MMTEHSCLSEERKITVPNRPSADLFSAAVKMTVVRPIPETAEAEIQSGQSATTQPRAFSSDCTSTATAPPPAGTVSPAEERAKGAGVSG